MADDNRVKIFLSCCCFRHHTKGAMHMQKKLLKDLNLLDDFLFYTMTNHPLYGESFSRLLLKIIFNRDFGKLKVVPQKAYYGSDTDKHGARLDVFIEEDPENDSNLENATICDIEPEQKNISKDIRILSRRVRFYHSKIDAGSLKSGLDYRNLKNVVVIIITPFDPFGYNHMVYTIKNSCIKVPELPYDDGAQTIFLYTQGKKGNVAKELQTLLQYMEHSTSENATNDTLQKIHNMVQHVKQDEEVSLEYMKIYEKEQMLIEEGRQEAELKFQEEIRQLHAMLAEKDKMLAEKDKALAELSAAQKEL